MKFWALSYSLPANPSRYRVAVWKALKNLGAIYLQPAVAVAPQREGMRESLLEIKTLVLDSAGEAALLTLEYDDEADEAALLVQFRSAREEEYAGIADDVRRLGVQLDWEERGGRVPDAETLRRYGLEYGRLRRRLTVAQTHDFFGAPGSDEATAALDEVAGRLPETEGKKRPSPARKKKAPAKPAPFPAAVLPETESVPEVEEKEERAEMPVFLF